MKNLVQIFILSIVFTITLYSQEISYTTESNLHYYPDQINSSDEYINERCVLDIYYPENLENYATIIWFHGGGLTTGEKFILESMKKNQIAIVSPNYRLYPKVKAPVYIEDAAAAVAWVFENIDRFGGDTSKIFISGHSAGGYLASMVGLDKRWLADHNIDANKIAGLIPFSGHTITHFTVREERGIPGTRPIVDDLAPLYHVRADAPPLILITGDRELELLGRYEENAYMYRMMKVAGHTNTKILELDGYDHGMVYPAIPILVKEVKRISQELEEPHK